MKCSANKKLANFIRAEHFISSPSRPAAAHRLSFILLHISKCSFNCNLARANSPLPGEMMKVNMLCGTALVLSWPINYGAAVNAEAKLNLPVECNPRARIATYFNFIQPFFQRCILLQPVCSIVISVDLGKKVENKIKVQIDAGIKNGTFEHTYTTQRYTNIVFLIPNFKTLKFCAFFIIFHKRLNLHQ